MTPFINQSCFVFYMILSYAFCFTIKLYKTILNANDTKSD